MKVFFQELCNWLSVDRFRKKVLFVRNITVGNQLLRMAANHGSPAVNVSALPVRAYINQLLEGELVRRGLQKIDTVTASIALQRIMGEIGGAAFSTMGRVELTTASRMLPQLEELEQNGLMPEDLVKVGQPLLASVWKAYLSWKAENRYMLVTDMAALDPLVEEDVQFAVLSNVCLSRMEQDFLARIPASRLTVIHLDAPLGVDMPRNMFSGVLSDVKTVPVSGIYDQVSCVECQDIGTEIRAAFQRLIEQRVPGEDTVFVCPDDSYAMRAEEEGKLLGIPVDSAFGQPVSMSSSALLIRCLLEWSVSDYDAEALAPALLAGAMAVYDEEKKLLMAGPEMLRTFRNKGVGWSKERWEHFSWEEHERVAMAAQSVFGWVLFFEAGPRPVRELASVLTNLLWGSMRRSVDNELYLNIVDEMSRIYPGDMTGHDFLEIVQEIADGMRMNGHPTDRPGYVYCCSYENAMYVDRSHFVLLGMSWDAFNKLGSEFPLLHDEEKKQLSPSLRLVSDAAAEKRYAVLELLLNREDASVVFSRARTGFVGGEEIMAAGIFDDAAAKYKGYDPETGKEKVFVPQVNILGRKALTESDVRMKDGYVPHNAEYDMDDGYLERWQEEFASRVWSPTGLETAMACPRKFVLQRQLQVKEEDPAALERFGLRWLDSLSRGNLVHEVLDRYFHDTMPRVEKVDDDLLMKLVDDQVEAYRASVPVPVNLTDITPEIETIRKIVRQVAGRHAADSGRKTVGTEISFGDDKLVELEFGPFTIQLTGRIDRVDRVPDGIEIIDYKTGSPYRFRRDFGDKLQYYLYTLAWEKMHPDQPVVRSSYELLDGPGGAESLVVEMTPDVREEMYGRITGLLQMLYDPDSAVLPANLIQTPDGQQKECSTYCPYREICAGRIGQYLTYLPPEDAAEGDSADSEKGGGTDE